MPKQQYIGRFAPSPSGPLHFGSLVCALASFLHARIHQGKWLVRIEDIDTPRINPNISPVILNSLSAHGLRWDDEVLYQSQRHRQYEQVLSQLQQNKRLYACACSRKQIKARSGFYDQHCRELGHAFTDRAIRFKQMASFAKFNDLFWGEQKITHPIAHEDPVLKRADGIYAYHLAVVTDDIAQNVTHIVRGLDLLDTTPVHLSLYDALGATAPDYLHIPVIAQKPNQKLSKQHHSPAIDDSKALDNLILALQYLGMVKQKMPDFPSIESCLEWAITHWSPNLLVKQSEILISVSNDVYSAYQSNHNEPTK